MAMTKEYIGYHFDADFLAWLRSHLIPEYADSIEVSADGTSYRMLRGGNQIAKITATDWTLYPTSQTTPSQSAMANVGSQVYGYAGQNAIAICYRGYGSAAKNNQSLVLFTHDNHGGAVVLMAMRLSENSTGATLFSQTSTTYLMRLQTSEINTVTSLQLKYNSGSVSCLCPFVLNTEEPEIFYTPDVFWCPVYQHSAIGTLLVDGARYFTFGPWMVKDA